MRVMLLHRKIGRKNLLFLEIPDNHELGEMDIKYFNQVKMLNLAL